MEVGELISFYRRQCGMTIDELAEKSGVAKGTLNKIMGGITKAPTLDNMKAIAKALGKRLADFDDEPEFADMLSPAEQTHIEKYRSLDKRGQGAVSTLLDYEAECCEVITRDPSYTQDETSVEQKKPIPASEDGQDELEEFVRKHKANLTKDQRQQVLEMMQAMIAPQKQQLSASAREKVDEKAPKTECPGPS